MESAEQPKSMEVNRERMTNKEFGKIARETLLDSDYSLYNQVINEHGELLGELNAYSVVISKFAIDVELKGNNIDKVVNVDVNVDVGDNLIEKCSMNLAKTYSIIYRLRRITEISINIKRLRWQLEQILNRLVDCKDISITIKNILNTEEKNSEQLLKLTDKLFELTNFNVVNQE